MFFACSLHAHRCPANVSEKEERLTAWVVVRNLQLSLRFWEPSCVNIAYFDTARFPHESERDSPSRTDTFKLKPLRLVCIKN